MKFQNERAYEIYQVLVALRETGRLGYAIAKNRKRFYDAIAEYESFRTETVIKYGELNEDGQSCKVKPENDDAFQAEMKPVATEEQEIDVYRIPEDVFVSGNLDSQQMFMLDWMIDEDKKE